MPAYQQGDAFETYIASLYEGLGCKVERNVLISGQQVDLLIRKTVPGMGTITSIVECKYLSDTAVSNQHIYDFANFFLSCRERHGITNAVVVTNSRFSNKAKCFAENHAHLILKTARDLENEILDVSQALLVDTRQYREAAIFDTFIHLRGHGRLPPQQRNHTINDVYAAVCEWLQGGAATFVTLLGDFGTGKTTILERVRYFCAEQYLSTNSFYIPVLFKLRNYRYHRTLQEFITQTIVEQFDQPLPTKLFFRYLGNGKFAVLLDGFDEISTATDERTRAEYFYDLLPLYGSASPAIMTCRPAYFVSPMELRRLLRRRDRKDKSFARLDGETSTYLKLHDKYAGHADWAVGRQGLGATIWLQTLQDDDIDEYLRKHSVAFTEALNVSWEAVRNFLIRIYDIQDLMRRPILLSMIVDTVLEGEMDVEAEEVNHGPASLYELYTKLNFDRDWRKSDSTAHFTPQQRREFAHYIALAMLRTPVPEVSAGDIESILGRAAASRIGKFSVEEAATDMRVCSFLTVSAGKTFRFTHRSFMEFFVAQFIALELLGDRVPGVLGDRLTNEVLYFLGNLCLCSNYERLIASIERTRGAQGYQGDFHENMQSNLGAAALHAGDCRAGMAFYRTRWDGCAFRKLKWRDHTFVDCNFYKSKFETIELTTVKWTNSLHEAAEFMECQINGGEWGGKLFNVSFKKVHFNGARIKVDSEKSILQGCTFDGCRVNMAGTVTLVSCIIEGTRITLEQWKRTRASFHACQFRNSEIDVEELGMGADGALEDVTLEDSGIFGLYFPDERLKKMIKRGVFSGCHGVIVTNESLTEITDGEGVMNIGRVFVMLQKMIADKKEMEEFAKKVRVKGAGKTIVDRLEWWTRRA